MPEGKVPRYFGQIVDAAWDVPGFVQSVLSSRYVVNWLNVQVAANSFDGSLRRRYAGLVRSLGEINKKWSGYFDLESLNPDDMGLEDWEEVFLRLMQRGYPADMVGDVLRAILPYITELRNDDVFLGEEIEIYFMIPYISRNHELARDQIVKEALRYGADRRELEYHLRRRKPPKAPYRGAVVLTADPAGQHHHQARGLDQLQRSLPRLLAGPDVSPRFRSGT